MTPETAPPPADWTERPDFARFIAERRLTYVAVGSVIGVGPQQVRHYCRRWDDDRRQIPRQEVLERIVEWTQREITAGSFYPPHLRPEGDVVALPVAAVHPAEAS